MGEPGAPVRLVSKDAMPALPGRGYVQAVLASPVGSRLPDSRLPGSGRHTAAAGIRPTTRGYRIRYSGRQPRHRTGFAGAPDWHPVRVQRRPTGWPAYPRRARPHHRGASALRIAGRHWLPRAARRHRRRGDRQGRSEAGHAGGQRTRAACRTCPQDPAGSGGHGLAHPALADRGPGTRRGHHRARHPAAWFRHRPRSHDLADPEFGRAGQQPVHKWFFGGRPSGGPARPWSQPHAGAGERTAHRRLSAVLRRQQQLHRHLQHSHVSDRTRGNPLRPRFGGVRLGCHLRRRPHHPEKESRWHHHRLPSRRHPARRRRFPAHRHHQRFFQGQVRCRVRP